MLLHIGIDDTDSPQGGCTTYIAALLVERLEAIGCRFVDYPNLLRLNPNAPWKTRGNGAICLRVEAPDNEAAIRNEVINILKTHSEFDCDNTNPGAVFHEGQIPSEIKGFYERVVQTIVDLDEAERLIDEYCSGAVAWKNRRGLIGALAAIGGTLEGDHTYELLTYRTPTNRGTPRRVIEDSIRRMDAVSPDTFNSVDPETGQVLITPRGPDPVLYGVRGETAGAVLRAFGLIGVEEQIERWAIFRTNQGTDVHFARTYKVSELKPRYPAVITGHIYGAPRIIEGGHVIITISDGLGCIDCAAYEPSGSFRKVILRLKDGDEVRAAGGVRETKMGLTLNLERLEVLSISTEYRYLNPRCPSCGGSTESMGRGQGLRCKKCGYRDKELIRIREKVPRDLELGIYLPPPRAERHLTKPLKRYDHENIGVPSKLFEPWHSG